MKITFIASCLLIFTLISCEKRLKIEADATFTNIGSTSADVHITGSVTNSNKKYQWGFSYDSNIVMEVPGMNYEHPGLTKNADYTTTLTGLSPSTTYYIRPYLLTDGVYNVYKEIPEFTTKP